MRRREGLKPNGSDGKGGTGRSPKDGGASRSDMESMRSYVLGTPHGARSSLFVSQENGQGIKKDWETLIYTGMLGPLKV